MNNSTRGQHNDGDGQELLIFSFPEPIAELPPQYCSYRIAKVECHDDYWIRYDERHNGALDITLGQSYCGADAITVFDVAPALADRVVLTLINLIPVYDSWIDMPDQS